MLSTGQEALHEFHGISYFHGMPRYLRDGKCSTGSHTFPGMDVEHSQNMQQSNREDRIDGLIWNSCRELVRSKPWATTVQISLLRVERGVSGLE